jgi:hypothetical protein
MPLGLLGRLPLVLDRSPCIHGLGLLGVTILASLFAVCGRVPPPDGGVLVAVFILYAAPGWPTQPTTRRAWRRHGAILSA